MNRTEFMKELEVLLANISVEERAEAVQYYNDYFDDAGIENEAHIILELENPAKVAKTIKAGLKGGDGRSSQYSETGYADTRFETEEGRKHEILQEEKHSSKNNKSALSIFLIVLIVIVGVPIIVPLAGGILAAILGILTALFAIFLSLIIVAVCLIVVGIALFIAGCAQLLMFVPLGLALMGAGLLVFVIGLISTVLVGKLCAVVIPAMVRGIVELCRKPFHRKAVSA